jgi:hypothetical protein
MYNQSVKEPIRKPRCRQKFELQKQKRIARSLHRRFVQFGTRIYLISPEIEVKKLNQFLLTLQDWCISSQDELFQHFHCDGELTLPLLNRIRMSLDRWEDSLRRGRKPTQDPDRKLERAEVAELRSRLQFAFKAIRNETQFDSTFLLTPAQSKHFESNFRQAQQGAAANLLMAKLKNLGRVVFWLEGEDAFQRFSAAILQTHDPQTEMLREVDAASQWCKVLLKRWDHEEHWVVAYEFKHAMPLAQLLRKAAKLRVLPAIAKAGFPECISHHRTALLDLRENLKQTRDRGFPVAMAAWATANFPAEPLPMKTVQVLRSAMSSNPEVMNVAKRHVKASYHEGYGPAIRLLDSREESIPFGLLQNVRRFFARGNSADDIEFYLDNFSQFSADYKVDLAKLRRLAERFHKIFGQDSMPQLELIHGTFRSDFQIELIDSVVRWLENFPALRLNRQMMKTVVSTLSSLSALTKFKPAQEMFSPKVAQWINKVSAVAECFPNESVYPKQLRVWLRRLGYYQRLIGTEVGLPKSLRKRLKAETKRRKEIEFLKAKVESGTATQKARERFVYLSSMQVDEDKQQRKNIRDAQEACWSIGLAALRKMMLQETSKVWTKSMGHAIHPSWSETRIAEIGNWVREMSSQQRGFCKNTLDRFAEHGPAYKSHMRSNSDWINRMERKGFAIKDWLFAEPKSTQIRDRKVTISIASDPHEVYMMGNYFGTCLSQGGCNQMSVLANAADANKQVLYVHDVDGTVLARQLIAIGRKDKLLHYCLYTANQKVVGENSFEDYRTAVDTYCRELAERVGLQLGNEGTPASLGNQFWYDDGEEDWIELPKPPVVPKASLTRPSTRIELIPGASFSLQAGYRWPAVSCTQSNYAQLQPRFQFE